MNDILAAEQKATGVSEWKVEHIDTDVQIAKATHEYEHAEELMPRLMAVGRLALAVHVKPECQQNFRKLGLLDNELLGIEQENVDEVVAGVLKNGTAS